MDTMRLRLWKEKEVGQEGETEEASIEPPEFLPAHCLAHGNHQHRANLPLCQGERQMWGKMHTLTIRHPK